MKSFFENFKNQFPSDLGGRYFAVMLGELFRAHPHLINAIWPKVPKRIKIQSMETEQSTDDTSGVKKKRRADLTIDGVLGERSLCINIEIKWKDEPHDGQIKDYMNKTGDDSFFMLISLGELPGEYKDDLDLIKSKPEVAVAMTCPDIFDQLMKIPEKDWLIEQFLVFLKENAMIYDEAIDLHALGDFMSSVGMAGLRLGRKTMPFYEGGPAVLRQLMNNINKVANMFYEQYKDKDSFRWKPKTDFRVTLAINPSDEDNIISDDGYMWFGVDGNNEATAAKLNICSLFNFFTIGILFEQGKEGRVILYSYATANNIYVKSKMGDISEEFKFPKAIQLEAKIRKNIVTLCEKQKGRADFDQLYARLMEDAK